MKVLVRNKDAFRNYEHKSKYIGGLKLSGAETKSLRNGQGSLQGAYLTIHRVHNRLDAFQILIKNLYIAPYQIKNMPGGYDPNAPRVVLVSKRELREIQREMNNKGTTLIPLAIGLSHNLIKIEFVLARGKKMHDKRETLKVKAQKRDAAREHSATLR